MSTIIDVAKIAGVSTATVSRVINSPETVRIQTRERVCNAMKLCRYKYNALARGFATKRSRTIGLIVPTITNSIFAESTRGVQDYANENNYHVILGNTDYRQEKEAKLVQVFREMQVEGMLITTTNLNNRALKDLQEDRFPFVLLYSTVRKGPMSCVGVDNFIGGYKATEHLIKFKHQRIAMLAGAFSFSDKSFHRWHGYRKCLRDNGIDYNSDYLIQSSYNLESGRQGVIHLMSLKKRPTAVFCSNDYLAIGAMEGAREKGLRLPEDLSVVGFDDIPMASFMVPALNTIRQPAYHMGLEGAQVLLSHIATPSEKTVHRLLGTHLIARKSVTFPSC